MVGIGVELGLVAEKRAQCLPTQRYPVNYRKSRFAALLVFGYDAGFVNRYAAAFSNLVTAMPVVNRKFIQCYPVNHNTPRTTIDVNPSTGISEVNKFWQIKIQYNVDRNHGHLLARIVILSASDYGAEEQYQ